MFSDLAGRWATALLQGAARVLLRIGISPNLFTFLAFWVVASISIILARGYLRLGGILLLLTAWFDAVDGTLARMSGRVSPFGAFLDATLDRYAESLIYLGLLIHYLDAYSRTNVILIYLTIVGSLIISYARAKAESVNIPCKEGLLTRFERLAILVLGLIFLRVEWALWILAPLANLTAIQRMVVVWRQAHQERV